jgi:hypothetical protein
MTRQVDKSNFNIPMSGDPRLHCELKWYAIDDDAVLGVVILDLVDKDYSWVVLTENDQGPGYMAIDMGHSLLAEDDATAMLHDAMRKCQRASGAGPVTALT